MYWADKIAEKIEEDRGAKKPLIIRDEKTASGRVHLGSLRGVVIHGIISDILKERNVANKYLFEINDFDPMDDLPHYLDKEKFHKYLGRPLFSIPSPDGKAKNYALYFADEFKEAIK